MGDKTIILKILLGQSFFASGHNWTLFEKYLPLMPLENENQLSSPLSEISKTIEKFGKSLDPKISPLRSFILPPPKAIDFKGEFKKHDIGIHVPANIMNRFRPWSLIQKSFKMQGKQL